MSPFGLKICERVFQTTLQKNYSLDFFIFFGRGGIFRKKCQFSEGRLPPQDVLRLAWKFVSVFFRQYCKKSIPRTFLVEVEFFGKSVKFREVVYPPRMSPFGLEICERVFQTILQQNYSQDFFGRGGIFRKKCQISEGRLPPEDVSVWLENL